MKKVNLCQPILKLDGTPAQQNGKDVQANEILSDILITSRPHDSATRQFNLALNIFNAKGEMELEDPDYELIKKIIPKAATTTLVIARLTKMLDM